ncbi:blood vessel epicardial substance-like isoform X1 [Cimex lectularius]|uniref:POPDC1-3 domain-containing protein n=1 Tax=Cimex lectularius TaxID=79782 RepID=A0A8I6RNG2_CIMLE|nr:blood vessel epicardial substance-like isoform X1 [Cimex lectularius]XP_024082526.1 blood vessel epicardial substance-like isoform X1 [Cimex lectularius]
MENCSLSLDNCTDLFLETNSTYESDTFLPQQICGEWEPAQHNLFQLSNLFFAAAFLVPRSYKQGIIILRALLSAGFFVQAVWSGVHVCSGDIVIWATVLGFLNLLHTVALFVRLIPPSLSPELTELYTRMFSPLKVSRKHFKELTKEASVLMLDPGDAYAVEEVTNADDRLSILLKGKLKVTCDSIHLHYISSYQFIDSPEWEAGHVTSDELFQVTITAEEESLYLCWPKLKLARVLRHRPTLKIILSNLIGKDITQKLYWLNEAVGLSGALGGKDMTPTGCEHFRRVMSRSLSADAVNTSTKGHVKSLAWRKQAGDKSDSLIFSDNESPLNLTQHEWWQPVVANQFLESSPFPSAIPPPINLMPVAPPTLKRSSIKRPREVKFEESNV